MVYVQAKLDLHPVMISGRGKWLNQESDISIVSNLAIVKELWRLLESPGHCSLPPMTSIQLQDLQFGNLYFLFLHLPICIYIYVPSDS